MAGSSLFDEKSPVYPVSETCKSAVCFKLAKWNAAGDTFGWIASVATGSGVYRAGALTSGARNCCAGTAWGIGAAGEPCAPPQAVPAPANSANAAQRRIDSNPGACFMRTAYRGCRLESVYDASTCVP